MENQKLTENASQVGDYIFKELSKLPAGMKLRGRGLMIGMEFPDPVKEIRNRLLNEFHIFTGFSGTNTIRLLPPLTLTRDDADYFVNSLKKIL
jgi:acetylornithine/N-succinyldiaminopimelate aminotransferase